MGAFATPALEDPMRFPSRLFRLPPAILPLLLGVAGPGAALERAAQRAPEDREAAWSRGGTCSVIYYNICTGWIWSWSNWAPGSRLGVAFDVCGGHPGEAASLVVGWMYVTRVAPPGYGFTATVSVHTLDAEGCPLPDGGPSQPLLPSPGWNGMAWGANVPTSFAVVLTTGPGAGSPLAFASDHPAIGPSGPFACGNCYPAGRTTRSLWWGTAEEPRCPGLPLFDGTCDAELLWDVQVAFVTPTQVSTWGGIKSLYR